MTLSFLDLVNGMNISTHDKAAIINAVCIDFGPSVEPTDTVDTTGIHSSWKAEADAIKFEVATKREIAACRRYWNKRRHKAKDNRQCAGSKWQHGLEMKECVLRKFKGSQFNEALASKLRDRASIIEALGTDHTEAAKAFADFVIDLFKPHCYVLRTDPAHASQPLLGGHLNSPANKSFDNLYLFLRAIGDFGWKVSDVLGGPAGLSRHYGNICNQFESELAAQVIFQRINWLLRDRIGVDQNLDFDSDEFREAFNAYLLKRDFRVSMRSSFGSVKHDLVFYRNVCQWLETSLDVLFAEDGKSPLDDRFTFVEPKI